jgi:hypothetical protein
MPRASASDRQYLECKNGKWRVSINVPRDLRPKLGTRLKHPLHTDSLAVANQIKWPIVAELKRTIDQARSTTGKATLVREAVELANIRSHTIDPTQRDDIDDAIVIRADEIAGRPIGEQDIPGVGRQPIYDANRERQAKEFASIAFGQTSAPLPMAATPVGLCAGPRMSA